MKFALNVNEAAKLIGLGRNATYEAVRRKELPSVRIGGRILIPIRALEEMFGIRGEEEIACYRQGSVMSGMNMEAAR